MFKDIPVVVRDRKGQHRGGSEWVRELGNGHLLAKPGRCEATAGLFSTGEAEANLSAARSRGRVPRHSGTAQLPKEGARHGRLLAGDLPSWACWHHQDNCSSTTSAGFTAHKSVCLTLAGVWSPALLLNSWFGVKGRGEGQVSCICCSVQHAPCSLDCFDHLCTTPHVFSLWQLP